MSSSTVHYRGQTFEANDAALEVWLQLLVREIDALDRPAPWMREMRDEWHLQSTAGFGFGVVPNLDRFAADEEHRAVILSLCERALHRLDTLGETASPADMDALGTGGQGAKFTRDVPTSLFKDTGRRFIGLLRGHPE